MPSRPLDPIEREEQVIDLEGRVFTLRAVRDEDGAAFIEMFERLSLEDVRFRFFGPLRELTPEFASRLTKLDHDREMAFVLCDPVSSEPSRSEPNRQPVGAKIYGVVRIAIDPEGGTAEFAVIVRTDMKHHGLGLVLMQHIIAYSKARGLSKIHGDVMRENENMLNFCHTLGFTMRAMPGEMNIVEVELDLRAPGIQAPVL
jgi:acetyltransferase